MMNFPNNSNMAAPLRAKEEFYRKLLRLGY